MRGGTPLDDADREPWLRALGRWMDGETAAGRSAVMGCSALKRAYRDLLLDGRPDASMVFLMVSREELDRRLRARHGPFSPEKLLASQLSTLEPPQPDEQRVYAVQAADTPRQTAARVLAAL